MTSDTAQAFSQTIAGHSRLPLLGIVVVYMHEQGHGAHAGAAVNEIAQMQPMDAPHQNIVDYLESNYPAQHSVPVGYMDSLFDGDFLDASDIPDRELLIAAASVWSGWCTDNEETLPELTQLGHVLMLMKYRMREDRNRENAWTDGFRAAIEAMHGDSSHSKGVDPFAPAAPCPCGWSH